MTRPTGKDDDPGPKASESENVDTLLNAIGTLAREEETAAARVPEEMVPMLSESTRARIASQILAAQSRGGVGFVAPSPASGPADALSVRRQKQPQSKRTLLFSGLALAVAAAAAFVLWTRPTDDAPPLPAYAVSAVGGVAEVRGAPPEPAPLDGTTTPIQRVRADSELRIACRPDTAVVGPVAVRTFFVQGNGVEEMRPVVQVAATGAAEIRVSGADLVGRHSGRGSLRVAVGRPGAIRTIDPRSAATAAAPTLAASEQSDTIGSTWLTVPLDLERH